MTDVQIRDVSPHVLRQLSTAAAQQGISRMEFLSRHLVNLARSVSHRVTVADLKALSAAITRDDSALPLDLPVMEEPCVPNHGVSEKQEASTWLVDASALPHLADAPNAESWAARIEQGLVNVCATTLLQVGAHAHSSVDRQALLHDPPLAAMPVQHMTRAIEDRALQVQALLTEQGHHATACPTDLLTAANAELTGAVLLHTTATVFDQISKVTGQPTHLIHPHP